MSPRHHNATIVHSLPPLSNTICASAGKVARSHGQGEHPIIGIAAFVAIAWLAGPCTITTEKFGTVNVGAGILWSAWERRAHHPGLGLGLPAIP